MREGRIMEISREQEMGLTSKEKTIFPDTRLSKYYSVWSYTLNVATLWYNVNL